MHSTLKAALILASAGIAAAQPTTSQPSQPAQPPVKERVSVPWHQAGPHRATAVRAGEPTPKQTVYTSINGKVVSGGEGAKEPVVPMGSKPAAAAAGKAPQAAKSSPQEVTMSRDTGWDHDDDADPQVTQVAKAETLTPTQSAPPTTTAPRVSLISHDAYVRIKSPAAISRDSGGDAVQPSVRFETGSQHLRAQPAARAQGK